MAALRTVAAILAVATVLAGCEEAVPEAAEEVVRPVKVVRIAEVPLRLERSYPATVLPSREVELSFELGGRIVDLPIRAAMQLGEGDVVARLDDRAYANAVAQLESERAAARADLEAMTAGAREEDVRALQAQVEAAQAEVDAASDQLDRSRQLFDRGVVTQVKLDEDQRRLRVANSSLRAAEEELAKGLAGARAEEVAAQRARIAGLDARLASARRDLENATLTAPFAGVVAMRMVDNFTFVQAKQPVALLQSIETLDLVFDIPGPDVAAFGSRDATAAFATLDAVPGERFEVTLAEFTVQADEGTQTYRGRVRMERPEGVPVLPGMVATVTVYDREGAGAVIVVPPEAVAAASDGAAFVWVVGDDGRVARRAVVMGDTVARGVVLSDGVAPGELVVTAGLGALQEGMTVRPREAPAS